MQENEEEKPQPEEEVPPPPPELGSKVESFGVSDVLTILVILLVGAGFWFWYHSAKDDSTARFQAAAQLWDHKDYRAAKKAYETLQEKAHFVSKENDTLMTHRLEKINEWEDNARALTDGVGAAIIASDTSLLRAARVKVAADTNIFVDKARLLARLDSVLTKEK